MLRSIPFFVGLRYTRAKRRNHFISFISLTSMLGIALGVTVLITVLSVMNGFERELRDRILGVTPHVMVSDLFGPVADWRGLATELEKKPGVVASAPYISLQAILNNGTINQFAVVSGIDPEAEKNVSILPGHMRLGDFEKLQPGKFGIILGELLARSLGVGVGDKVAVITPEGSTATIAGAVPAIKQFKVVGTFKIGAEMDANMALVHIKDAGRLAKYGPDEVSGVRLKLADLFDAPFLAAELRDELQGSYYTSDWTRIQGSLFSAIKMEKRMMFLLLMLIIAVAAFNIVSTLVMAVTDKQSDIAILRTLGASPRTIMGIFVVQGSVNGLIGTLLGLVGGLSLAYNVADLVAWIEQVSGQHFLSPDVYFISFLPSEIHGDDVGFITLASVVLSLLATLYPAWRASRIQPAEALRYE
ncbi:MAG: lipoprotein-releasing ABC transporter permease subunit [Gammaproteobacteria bacterium]|nr:lipoprotein-releasing ABC transporter permease subunit [Gammaproteobacteria bacterium]